MNNLYEALEVCLQDMELGADIETSLSRYPNLADELRPILETSVHAKRLASSAPSEAVMQRNRAKLLQRAAEMRNARLNSSSTPSSFNSFRRAAIALAVLVIVFLSGTRLVRASSTSLPGDNLYPVKRASENLALLFTVNQQARDSLAVEYENERLEELHELISIGRSAEVDFAGIVTQQIGNKWLVAGVPVLLTPQTDLHDGPVSLGDAVRVFGITQRDNSVLAERIDQLPEGASLPDHGNSGQGSDRESNSGSGSHNNDNGNDNDSSGPGNGNDNSNENNSVPGEGTGDNSNDNSSGPGGGNENGNDSNSGPGGGDITNDDNSGSGSGNENENNNGSGSGRDQSNDKEDNSGSGGGGDNSNEDNSGSGGGGDDD